MIEDSDYLSTTQYRHWSFTPAELAKQRERTNSLAAERVREAHRRSLALTTNGELNTQEATLSADADDKVTGTDVLIDTLTVEEELRIIQWGSSKILEMRTNIEPRPPSSTVATAIQYLRRFYLTNSPMTYHPKQILVCALYVAMKAEHFYVSIANFIKGLQGVTEDDVRAPEFLLMQGIRFMLDVKHPLRGLDGGMIEIKAAAKELSCLRSLNQSDRDRRIGKAYEAARAVLMGPALMTDVYFMFTPSQIWLSSLRLVDREMQDDLLDNFLSRIPNDTAEQSRIRLVQTIDQCTDILRSYKSPENDKATRKELARIGKKLQKCQNPEKLDILAVTRAKAADKREGSGSEREDKIKKRKLEREKLERDGDVFGGDLQKVTKKAAATTRNGDIDVFD